MCSLIFPEVNHHFFTAAYCFKGGHQSATASFSVPLTELGIVTPKS